MDVKNSTGRPTCQKLLIAACEVFAENGFKNTTVRDICTRADVNVAAVNYHFGSKEKLYEAVWDYSNRMAVKNRMDEIELARAAGPEERLRIFIRTLLYNILNHDRPEWDFRIVAHEMIRPTGAFDQIVERMILPGFVFLRDLVRELLGESVSEEKIKRYSLSIVGQCLYYRFANPVVRQIFPEQSFNEKGIEELADHITRFSLSAFKQIRADIEQEENI